MLDTNTKPKIYVSHYYTRHTIIIPDNNKTIHSFNICEDISTQIGDISCRHNLSIMSFLKKI